MHLPPTEKLITTKEAGEISGYTSDYLARLARAGKIVGRRVGHSWLIDRESLTRFLSQQGDRKIDYARALARAREVEYRAHRSAVHRITRTLTKTISMPRESIVTANSLRSQALALSVALVVVVSGALVARAAAEPRLAHMAAELASEAASGFSATFGAIPSRIIARIEKAGTDMRAPSERLPAGRHGIATNAANASAGVAPSFLSDVNLSSLQMVIDDERASRLPAGRHDITLAQYQTSFDTGLVSNSPMHASTAPAAPITIEAVQAGVLAAYAFVTTPSFAADALARAYVAFGVDAYATIGASFSAYRSLIERAGTETLALATASRDAMPAGRQALAATPRLVDRVNLAFGTAIIEATHAAIRADVMTAYGTAAAAPTSARVTVALIGGMGGAVALAAERAPALAVALYLHATGAPATLAPRMAQAVFGAEYTAAARFIALTGSVSENYLALVEGTGRLAYTGTAGALALSNAAVSRIAHVPASLGNAYLGMPGKGAFAFDTRALLAAALPPLALRSLGEAGLSAGERAALVTYESINGFWRSASDALAFLAGSPPSIVLPSVPRKTRVVAVTATSRAAAPAPRILNSYPTYTTVVQGVSQETMNQSLAALRADVLATAAGMLQPVAAQGVTNMNSIQQVNMIQDLSNLIVRNGDFRGGNLTNGIYVGAATGHFDNLTGGALSFGAASFATTTVNGDLTVSGTATSTFAGNLSVAGNINLNGALLQNNAPFIGSQWATSGSNISYTTGSVGIGTTSPSQALSVQGNGLFSGNLSVANFTATGTATIGVLSGVVGANSGALYAVASSSLFGFTPASSAITITSTYPLTGGGDLTANRTLSLAFGTTTSNTWGGTQTFTNAPTLATFSGLLAGNSGATYAVSTTSMNASITGQSGSVTNSITFNNGGAGAASGSTFNGGSALTVSYNTIGAQAAGSYESPLTFNAPLQRSSNTISWTGLATTSQPSSSNLLVSNGTSGVYGVATTSQTLSSEFSDTGTFGALIGGTSGTLSLANAGVTYAKLQNLNYGEVIGRNTAGAGVATGLSTSTYKSMLALTAADVGLGNVTNAAQVTAVTGTYPVQSSGGTTPALSLAFGTTTSNTWANTQTFTNPIVNGTLSGLIAGNSGTTYQVSTTSMNASITGQSGSVANSITFNNGGAGAASGSTFNGGSALTVSYNTIGAQVAGSYESPLTFNAPLLRSANTVTWTGLATTSQPSSSNLLVSNGTSGVYGVATTSATCSTGISCTGFNVLGAANPSFALAALGSAGVLGAQTATTPTVQATSTLYGVSTGGMVLGWNNTTNGIGWVATTTGTNYWMLSGSSLYNNSGTNIGIGTTSPFANLSLAGAAGGATNLFAVSTSTAGYATTTALTIDGNGKLSLLNGASLSVSGTAAISGSGTTTLAGFIDVNGTGTNATSTFAGNLWVKGTLRTGTGSMYLNDAGLTSSDGTIALSRTATSTLGTNGLAVGTSQFVVQQTSGSVGIGTAAPAYALDVTGNIRATSQVRAEVANGTAPLVVNSTTKVANLNADLLDGLDSSAFGDATAANQTTILSRIGTNADATTTPSAASSIFSGMKFLAQRQYKMQTFTSSGTWTWPGSHVSTVWVTMVGGGGGGGKGGDNGSGIAGGGGGGGGQSIFRYPLAVSGNVTVTVGNGGGSATNGGNTLFGSLTAIGGFAGASSGSPTAGGKNGSGGSGNAVADFIGSTGGGGGNGGAVGGAAGLYIGATASSGGGGGSSSFGKGGAGGAQGCPTGAVGTGGTGNGSGGGGGGAATGSCGGGTGGAGGSGSSGIVIVEWFE